jgi:dTDP-4-amino-4,6-dideoxygalactose transaminase
MGFKYGDFPESERYYSEAISLPMYQTLSDSQQDSVIFSIMNSISSSL